MDRFADCSIRNYGYHCGKSSENVQFSQMKNFTYLLNKFTFAIFE